MNNEAGSHDYRDSHATPNYGAEYSKTYQAGYYKNQWEWIEKPLLRNVFEGLRESGKTDCLDFACGTGRITSVLEKVFPSVLGVDVSETMLEQARKNCSQASFLQQDITLHPLESSFDVITAFRFFLNAQPELRRSALAAMHNVLRDDGRIILNIHVNRSSILGMAYRLRNRLKGEVVAHTCSYEEIEEYLNEAGFAIEDEFWYSYLPRTGWRLNSVSRVMMRPFEKFSRAVPFIPRKMAQSFLLVAHKQ